jgi:hypothetical protein
MPCCEAHSSKWCAARQRLLAWCSRSALTAVRIEQMPKRYTLRLCAVQRRTAL